MIKHLMKLVWNRKRANILITLEIFACFLVLFATLVMVIYYVDNYRQPRGFDYTNVWSVGTAMSTLADMERNDKEAMKQNTAAFFHAIKNMPEVESLSVIAQAPYTISVNNTYVEYKGKRIRTAQNHATDDLPQVLNLELVRGRWFGPADDGLSWNSVVINRKLAEELFGDEDPIGKDVSDKRPRKGENGQPAPHREWRVVGVLSEFRKEGEFSAPEPYIFQRSVPGVGRSWDFLIKVRPDVTKAFEETLIRRLHMINPNWSFEVDELSQLRDSRLSWQIAPMIAAGIVVAFLMIMVALGLVGVVWQSVSQRTTEIGLRRALGAPATSIYKQILGELVIISSCGLLVGVLVVVQFPLLDLVGFLSGQVYFYSLLASLGVIYAVTLLCGLYPSRIATKIQPVEALRWE